MSLDNQQNPQATAEDEQAEAEKEGLAQEEVAATAATADMPVLSGKQAKRDKTALTSEQKKKLVKNIVIVPCMILISAFIRSVCVRLFMTSPALNFAPGGVTGIGTMIEYKTNGAFSTGYTNLIINFPLIIIAFIFLSKAYAIKTACAVGLSSAGMVIMQQVEFPQYGVTDAGVVDPTAQPVLGAIACGVLLGVGVAIMIRAGASNGGTDIIAALIQRKYEAAGITWFIMAIDATVVVSSYFVYDRGLTPVLMSFTQQFTGALVGDFILTGFKSAIKYEIITDDPEELSAELIAKLKHSVTKIDAMGMYAHSEKALLVCVIHKRQVTEFNNILKKYKNTFAYVTSTSEVFGKFV